MALESNEIRAAFSIASALAMLFLGLATLSPRRARARGALAFGLFASAWGLQILLGNLYSIFRFQGSELLQLCALALVIPLPYFLIEFATALSPASQRRAWGLARFAVAALALANGLLMLTLPQLYFSTISGSVGASTALPGPLYAALVGIPFFLSFGAALAALWHAYEGAPTLRSRLRVLPLLLGIGLYAGFQSAFYVSFYGVGLFLYPIVAKDIQLLATFIPLALVVAYVVRRIHAATPVDATRLERAVPYALGAALGYGLLEGAFASAFAPLFSTLGLWRLAGVAVIAYGLARWRVFDLPQRARSAAATMGGATLAAGSGAAAFGAGTLTFAGLGGPVVIGLLVTGAALLPSLKFMRRLVAAPMPQEVADQQAYGQRLDTYRAALESSIARGTLVEDEPFLEGLRERFNITDDEHRVVLHYARSSVVVARDGDAWGAYERLRLLGEGGSGRTWLARDRSRDRLVVLKEPLEHWQRDPSLREAVLREARLASRVRHPNVVRVEEVVDNKGNPVIVMEYCEGGSLTDLLRSHGTLPWRDACALTLQVARGLEAVHGAGIVHRDIKPSNILLDADGVPKVGDFGIALAPAAAAGGRTMIGVPDGVADAPAVAGTPSYMAPEAREGRGDRRVDVYGLTAVLHECVYGAPPSVDGPVVVRSDVSTELSRILARGLARTPEERYPSARAFADDLSRLVKP